MRDGGNTTKGLEKIRVAAKDILAVFMHPVDENFDELFEAIKGRLTRLVSEALQEFADESKD